MTDDPLVTSVSKASIKLVCYDVETALNYLTYTRNFIQLLRTHRTSHGRIELLISFGKIQYRRTSKPEEKDNLVNAFECLEGKRITKD